MQLRRSKAQPDRRTGRFLVAAAVALSMVGAALPSTTASAALPAGSAPAGKATLVPSSGTTTFRITLPSGAACPGDSASGGYRWQTFIAASAVDVSQAVYAGGMPSVTGGGLIDVLYSLTNPIVDQNTAVVTGAIVGLPNQFEFTTYLAGSVPAGTYRIGVACTLAGAVERYWSTTVKLTLDGGGVINGFSPFLAPAAGPAVSSPLTVGVSGTISGSLTAVTATPAVTSYTVTAQPSVGSPVSVQVVPPATDFVISGLSNRTTYTVTAIATNDAGDSSASAGVTAVPYVANPAPTLLAAGGAHSCAVLTGGAVQCWGQNANGQLGNGTLVGSTAAVPVSGLAGATAISAGDQFTCAAAAGRVKCWGANAKGQLGNGSVARATTPVQVMATSTAALTGVSKVATGAAFACAVLSPGVNGTVRCWGGNAAGQLGDGTLTQRLRAVKVKSNATTTLKGVTSVAAGGSTACAVFANGAVRCWGLNSNGQLGNNTLTSSKYPVQVTGINGVTAKATAVAVGADFACARLSTGAVRCWGANASGQLGNNTITRSKVPVAVKVSAAGALTGATTIAAGARHVCVTRGTGTSAKVWCWGNNSNGQLGLGTLVNRRVATLLTSATTVGAKGLALGAAHTLALVPSTVRTPVDAAGWGRNADGQLGIAGTPQASPVVNTSL